MARRRTRKTAKRPEPGGVPSARPTTRRRVLKAAPKEPFPWWPFLLLLLSLGLFWGLPRRLGNPPVQVRFAGER